MLRWLLCGWLVLVPSLGLSAQEGPKETIKQDFKVVGKAVGTTAVKVGHAVRDGAKATGRAIKRVGHSVAHGGHKAGQGSKAGTRGGQAVPPPE